MFVDSVGLRDRALQYGDGFFTTILVEKGQLCLWHYHQARLVSHAQTLAISLPDIEQIKAELDARVNECSRGVLKLLVSRGEGGRAYSPTGANEPALAVYLSDYPSHYQQLQLTGLRLADSEQPLASGGQVTGLKTLNRLEQVLLRRDAERLDVDELVCTDIRGNLVEGVSANICFRKGNTLYVPALSFAGIKGVQRQWMIDNLEASPFRLVIDEFPIAQLREAEEIIVSNAILQFAPVKSYNQRHYDDFSATQWLLSAVNTL